MCVCMCGVCAGCHHHTPTPRCSHPCPCHPSIRSACPPLLPPPAQDAAGRGRRVCGPPARHGGCGIQFGAHPGAVRDRQAGRGGGGRQAAVQRGAGAGAGGGGVPGWVACVGVGAFVCVCVGWGVCRDAGPCEQYPQKNQAAAWLWGRCPLLTCQPARAASLPPSLPPPPAGPPAHIPPPPAPAPARPAADASLADSEDSDAGEDDATLEARREWEAGERRRLEPPLLLLLRTQTNQ